MQPRCKSHKKKFANDYIRWHLYAEEQNKKGIKQEYCLKCQRWFYPEEF